MMSKGLTILLLMCVAGISNGHREKRFLTSFLPSKEPQKPPTPVYKVHKYTGIHLIPIHPGHHGNVNHGLPEISGEAPSVVEVPDETYDGGYNGGGSGLGSLISLLPASTSLLSGALSFSGGSSAGGGDDGGDYGADERIGLAAKKNYISSWKQKKKGFVASVASGALNAAISKGETVKGFVKGAITGGINKASKVTTGIYRQIPFPYPNYHPGFLSKIPLVGTYFATSHPLELPEVNLPYLPGFIAVPSPPHLPVLSLHGQYELPFKTGAYVKIKFPGNKNYPIPSTSYGTPDLPVPVPEAPEENEVDVTEPPVTSTENSFPYPPQAPESETYVPPPPPPPTVPDVPKEPISVPPPPFGPESFPYPPASYPYPPSGYYDAAGSENHEIKVRVKDVHPVYNHKEVESKQEEVDFIPQENAEQGMHSKEKGLKKE